MCYVLSTVRQRGPGGPISSRAAARRRRRIWPYGCRHARRRRPANSRVHDVLLASYPGPTHFLILQAIRKWVGPGYEANVLQFAGLAYLPTVLLRAWMLQDLRRTEMRGYGVGGNEKGHAALAKRPNKGYAD